MAVVCKIFRHELPTAPGEFTIEAHGIKSLSVVMENDIPVMYEIGCVDETDNKPWPHHFAWIFTDEPLPKGLHATSFCGTVVFEDGLVAHLFHIWRV